jgi:tetratricopeptide (TPR) repeat protein
MKKALSLMILMSVGMMISCSLFRGERPSPWPEHLMPGYERIEKGMSYFQKGCSKRALEQLYGAHELFVAANHQPGIAMSLNNIGTVYCSMGDPESAYLFFHEAYRLYVEKGDREGALQSLCNAAAALIDENKLEEGEKLLDEAAILAKQDGRSSFIPLLRTRGILLTKKGDYKEAESILKKTLSDMNKDDKEKSATVNFALGNVYFETDRYQEAIRYFEAARLADEDAGFYRETADDLYYIGACHYNLGNDAKAVEYWQQCVQSYAILGMKEDVQDVMEDLRDAAERSAIDIDLTEIFVNHWLEGKAPDSICD